MTKTRKFRAESFDLMQYLYGAVHAPLIHAEICFAGMIDENFLIQAVSLSAEHLPQLRCGFGAERRRPCWWDRGYTGDDIVKIVAEDSSVPNQAEKLLSSDIDLTSEPPMKIYILRGAVSDTLCVIISHLLCDGAGFKEYLYLLSALYTAVLDRAEGPRVPVAAPRNIGQIFSALGPLQTMRIALSKSTQKKQDTSSAITLQGDKSNPFFVTCKIGPDSFARMKIYAKRHGETINDLILTAYARTLKNTTGQAHIAFPCPVDLRKYLRPQAEHGICNLTSNYICDVTIADGDSFETTLLAITKQMKEQKSSTRCLKPVLALSVLFRLLPFNCLQKLFYRAFTIPVLSYTNLGVIDPKRLRFGALEITDVFLTGAVKYVPYFQIAVSSFNSTLTLSSNLHGTEQDRAQIESFLAAVCGKLEQSDF